MVAAGDSVVTASSSGLGWDGIATEIGWSNHWGAEGVAFRGHALAMNLASDPLVAETRGPHGRRRTAVPSGSLIIYPAGTPFAQHNLGTAHWGCVQLSPDKVRRVLGRDVDVRAGYGIDDAPLAALARALFAEVAGGGTTGPLFADGMAVSVTARLAHLFGVREEREGVALEGARLKRVIDRIEEGIAQPMGVEELAAIAGLSPAHFSREFKRVHGQPPHAFVLGRRLERARGLLEGGASIADAALRCGFSDQAHLSRLFKRRFGVTPGRIAREGR
jgi:AraC family transcriptional regulator